MGAGGVSVSVSYSGTVSTHAHTKGVTTFGDREEAGIGGYLIFFPICQIQLS